MTLLYLDLMATKPSGAFIAGSVFEVIRTDAEIGFDTLNKKWN
jgi:hypothetical protein